MEQIKQEIINNIYENGENLITGPVLQTVLLDMVDDVNSKVASASVAPDIVDKTGSWNDAADWVEENSSSLVHENDLDGYATEQWVEDQGYLKEHQDLGGYATTESLNNLSESVANDLANLPEPDLSDYATKEYVEATSASVKEWVENKHYLTTASLSGSVTEESVQFMINDATASVKTWVGDQDYATETFVSQAIAEIPGTDLTGYATEQWVQNQGYLTEHQDISGLATTQSVTSLSESVASLGEEISSIWDTTADLSDDITSFSESVARDLENYVQEREFTSLSESISSDLESKADNRKVNNLSESVAQDFANLDIPDVSGYATTESLNQVSSSLSASIAAITGSAPVDYVTTSSFNALSESVVALSESVNEYYIEQIWSAVSATEEAGAIQWNDESEEYTAVPVATSESVGAVSESFSRSIENLTSEVAGKANARDLTSLSESVAQTIENLPQTDLSGYLQTSSYLVDSASFDQRISSITGSDIDLSGYATTASLNSVSQSISQSLRAIEGNLQDKAEARDLTSLSESVATDLGLLEERVTEVEDGKVDWDTYDTEKAELSQSIYTLAGNVADKAEARDVTSLSESVAQDFANLDIPDVSGYATTQSVNSLSASFAETINNIPGTDLSGYATTESVNQLSSSVATDIQSARTEAAAGFDSVNQGVRALSASFDQRINSLDLSEFLFGTGSASGSESIFPSASNWVVEVSQSTAFILDSELEEGRSIQVIYHNAGVNSVGVYFNEEYWGPYSVVNGVLGSGSFEIPAGEYGDVVATRIGDRIYFRTSLDVSNIEADLSEYATTESVNTLSASFDQRISSIPGSDIDLSEYATTESVNTLSASFAETIDNIPTGGNYLPITGGTLTGNLFVGGYNSIGVGTTKVGNRSLAVGNSSTSTQGGTYALAVGENCSTDVYGGVALGRETRVNSEPFGVAVGFRTRVDKMSGFAGGCLTTASGQFSFAAGFGAVSKGTGQVVLGSFNEIDGTGTGTGSYAVILGNGKSSTWNQDNPGDVVRSNGLAIKWDGGVDINYSGSTITLQDKIAELENSADISGLATTASLNELSESVSGLWKRGAASYSLEQIVEPLKLNSASGTGSLAQGQQTKAVGPYSHAEGFGTWAEGVYSHAEGDYSHASGSAAHAEGYTTLAGGNYSHAEGNLTKAIGNYSHAEGSFTTSSGDYSHAEGSYTIASGAYSHAEGNHTVTSNDHEHAEGLFNATASNQIFSIGAGEEFSSIDRINRRNALTVLAIPAANGILTASVFVQGIGGYDGTNPTPGTNDLASVVNNLSSSLDLSGYATTQSLNVLNSRVTDLSSSFDTRISQIVAASGGLDPADFAGAPTIVYQTDGTTGLVGVNFYTGSEGTVSSPAFDDTAWQLENLDLSNFDRIECYFKNSSTNPATIVTVILDSAAAGSGADTYSGTSMCPRITFSGRQVYEVEVAVDTSKTKLQVPYQFRVDTNNSTYTDASSDGNYLYKIVGYPKIV